MTTDDDVSRLRSARSELIALLNVLVLQKLTIAGTELLQAQEEANGPGVPLSQFRAEQLRLHAATFGADASEGPAGRYVKSVVLAKIGNRYRVDRLELTDQRPRSPQSDRLSVASVTLPRSPSMTCEKVVALFVDATPDRHRKPSAEQLACFEREMAPSLARMARRIDELRVLYRSTEEISRRLKGRQAAQRRVKDSLTALRRQMKVAIGGDAGAALQAQRLIEEMERLFEAARAPAAVVAPWHECAKKLAAAYELLFEPTIRGWSKEGHGVRFVAAALKEVTGRRNITRSAVAEVLRRAGT